jgi:hypothetical protein
MFGSHRITVFDLDSYILDGKVSNKGSSNLAGIHLNPANLFLKAVVQ